MINLTYHSDLYYVDEPLVYLCRDAFGTFFLCVAADEDYFREQFGIDGIAVACRVTPATVMHLKLLRLTVNEAFGLNAEDRYLVTYQNDKYAALSTQSSIEEFVPGQDFVLETRPARAYDELSPELIKFSYENERIGLRLKMSQAENPGIELSHAANVMQLWGRVFTATNKKLYPQYSYSTVAHHAIAASFDLYALVKPKSEERQFEMGFDSKPVALVNKVADVLRSIIKGENYEDELSLLQGHAFQHLRTLLEYLDEHQLLLLQEIFDPYSQRSSRLALSSSEIHKIATVLGEHQSLSTETLSVLGKFTLVDSKTGSWRFVGDEGSTYKGKADAVFISGLTVDNVLYNATIRSEIEEDNFGNQTIKHVLDSQPQPVVLTSEGKRLE